MKSLTIVRHAKSSWKNRGLSDRERPLNKRGERDAPIMGRRVATAGIRPSQIISSPAVRAWTTARVFAKELGYPTALHVFPTQGHGYLPEEHLTLTLDFFDKYRKAGK